jgi:hypothetical protein
MPRRVEIALYILLCTWATTSQAGVIRQVSPWSSLLLGHQAATAAVGRERILCISPCNFLTSLTPYSAGKFPRNFPIFSPRTKLIDGPNLPRNKAQERPIVSALLLKSRVPANQIPVPATLHLIVFSLAGLMWSRRKKT